MHLVTRNVNTAFASLCGTFYRPQYHNLTISKTTSRNGPVLCIEEPMIITYQRPWERVLFNEARDANPFFHLYESLWMLAGRNDVDSIAYYASKVGQYSDDGEVFNGAYGHRWRNRRIDTSRPLTENEKVQYGVEGVVEGYEKIDQLDYLIKHLQKTPNSRRAVLQMWDVENDLVKIDSSKDVCCNLSVLFTIKLKDLPITSIADKLDDITSRQGFVLDMTVLNRSNDLILGALGANAVHFSFLQEYMACALGVRIGHYHQITNNLHIYLDNCKLEEWIASYTTSTNYTTVDMERSAVELFEGSDQKEFDCECNTFVDLNRNSEAYRSVKNPLTSSIPYTLPFFRYIAAPMMNAFHAYKEKNFKAANTWCSYIHSKDWYIAAKTWITKREQLHKARQSPTAKAVEPTEPKE